MSEKPEVRKLSGTNPWVVRLNPNSGMFTRARRFGTWDEAMWSLTPCACCGGVWRHERDCVELRWWNS